jgi:energy-coupling factor transport system ATP-binding protein
VSLAFAAVFIGLRIAYRLAFGSFSWPAIGQAASLAVPFAIVIVVCGFLSALIDVRRLLPAMSGLRFGRSVGTALAIALAAYPTLIHQVTTLNTARKLRGMRSRSAFLVPLLEHTVEKAVALAAAMDLRGFGTRSPSSLAESEIVFTDFGLTYGQRSVLKDVSLTFAEGSLTVLTGLTGSGKTALLDSIAGLSQHFHHGETTGSLTVGGRDRSTLAPRETTGVIGYVQQNVRLGFAAATAREELEFGLRVTGRSRIESRDRALDLVDQFGLGEFADKPIELLSAGQATRVAIAAALTHSPHVLLLDEPLADLDTDSSVEIVNLFSQLHTEHGITIVIAEHQVDPLITLAPRWLTLSHGTVIEGREASAPVFPPREIPVVGNDVVLLVENLSVSHDEEPLLDKVSFTARVGEILAVVGANGAGKSSLLTSLATDSLASITVSGGRSVLVPENVSSLFISETVEEELARADRVACHAGSGLTALTFWSILERESQDSAELLVTHPRDASAGTQLALAIAIQLSWKPSVILIDEPTRGLDARSRDAMAEVLRCVAETGTVVLFATHDQTFVSSLDCRVLRIQHGTLTSVEVNA